MSYQPMNSSISSSINHHITSRSIIVKVNQPLF